VGYLHQIPGRCCRGSPVWSSNVHHGRLQTGEKRNFYVTQPAATQSPDSPTSCATAESPLCVVNHLIELPSSPLQPAQNITRGHILSVERVIQPACNIRYATSPFFFFFLNPAGISIWNALPQTLVSADSLENSKQESAHMYPN
jgi:hypothetical protein